MSDTKEPSKVDLMNHVWGMLKDTKITDWKVDPAQEARDKRKAEIDAAEYLRNKAELLMGFCHIDPERSCVPRKRLIELNAERARRAAMSPKERASVDLLHARAAASVKIQEREGLTIGEMQEVQEALPV